MTNGEKIKEIFPNIETTEITQNLVKYVRVEVKDENNNKVPSWVADININQWNTEYKEPTTRSDCAKQNGCITCSLDEGDDCCRKLLQELFLSQL